MYRQIWVDPKHTPFLRILFRNNRGEIRDFELKTVTFGVNCAPFLAIRVLQQLAADVELSHPKASNIIRNFMYVDDVLAGADSTKEAQLMVQELRDALNSAGFPLRKWTFQKEVLAAIQSNHLLNTKFSRDRCRKLCQNPRYSLEGNLRRILLRPARVVY
ncbi:uncharacterized protein LOC122319647 [Drosophila yakuba]|uniref:uncharacterized protein LOC122319647 n=1 Tax=Drosophila yakuba TaxID=7245 RepID=UPI001C8AD910|nr:uncharacterized protein LOC122319647 [Drosophila yakuba]